MMRINECAHIYKYLFCPACSHATCVCNMAIIGLTYYVDYAFLIS